jgi:protein-L-isoaspartate(D-aspartate) O-methyltransferase
MTGAPDRPRSSRGFPLSLDRLHPAPRGAAAPAQATVLRPQRPLQEALRDRQRMTTPSGLGLDSEPVRLRMTEKLRQWGVRDEQVLEAMARVPRHHFVDTALANQAYEDTSLPIGLGQTISKPSVVARMIELMRGDRGAQPLQRVLEIGTGCGYQAAVLGLLARQVVSIERLRALHEKAREHLAPLKLTHVRLIHGDGMLGFAGSAPYDGIIAAAGGEAIPPAWIEQLEPGGRLVAPTMTARGGQVLVLIENRGGRIIRTEHEPVHFVPLKSGKT